jgi:hypothetical protein
MAAGASRGTLPGEYCQPVHRGPDGVLEPGSTPPAEDAGVGPFVEYGAELVQGQGVLPCPAVWSAVGVLIGQGEGGREQPRLLAGGQLDPGGDQAVADGAARAPPPGPGHLTG